MAVHNECWKADIRAAKELCYPKKVIRMLEDEPNANKRSKILTNARKGVYNGYK